jgi:putative protease
MLPALRKAGVTALKIEGRQRGRAYIENVVRSFRQALGALEAARPIEAGGLTAMTEGQNTTAGAYRKTWR